jgi:poly(A)-specific ribonuclease
VLGSLYNTVYEELKEAGQDIGNAYIYIISNIANLLMFIIVMGEGFDRYTGIGKDVAHEAGYDAYMTGVIYLAFIAFIREKQGKGGIHLFFF